MADPDLNLQSNGTANGSVASISAPTKLGFSLSSKPKPTSVLLKDNTSSSRTSSPSLKRPHSLLDEDHHEDAAESTSTISTFGAGLNNEEKKEVKQERIIQGAPNKDWREEARRKRQRSGIPGQSQGQGADGANITPEVINHTGPAYGLTVTSRAPAVPSTDAATPPPPISTSTEEPSASASAPQPQPRSADDAALAALLDPTSGTSHTTIRAASPLDEDDAFRSDFRSAPRMATLDEYTATPVEGFGAAILRGYLKPGETLEGRTGLGWGKDVKAGDGKSKGNVNGLGGAGKKDVPGASREQRRDATGAPVRRPGLLGLGAKSEAGAGVELGAWGKGARAGGGGKGGGAKGAEIAYMPVAMRNRKTGEVVSEEEMRKMIDGQSLLEAGRGNGSREVERTERKMIEASASDGRSGRGGDSGRRYERDDDSEDDERRRRRRKEKERRRDDEARDEKSHRRDRDRDRDRDVKGSESKRSERSRRHDDSDVDDYARRDRRRNRSRGGDESRGDRRDGDRRHRERDGGSTRERDRDRDGRHDEYRDKDRHEHRSSRR